jgi:uncharacterized repeat protein (TIGR01451 family)
MDYSMNKNKLLKVVVMGSLLLAFLSNSIDAALAASSMPAGKWEFYRIGHLEKSPPPANVSSLVLPPAVPPQLPLFTPAITVTKTADPDPVNAGDVLTYTITVENGDASTGVTLVDTLDGNVSFISASDGGTPSGNIVTWNIGDVLTDDTVLRTLVVQVNNIASGTILSNQVSVSTNEGPSDTDTITTTVETAADLAIEKNDNPGVVIAGTTLTYTLLITNNGPSEAVNVVVSDTLPANFTLVSATPSQGACPGTDPVSCNLGNLASGASSSITIVTTVGGSVRGNINNTASVSSDTPDPEPGNNNDTEQTTVNGEANLILTKTDQSDPIGISDVARYTLTITNSGPSDATNVELIDNLPSNADFQLVTPGGPTCNKTGGIVTCNFATIANGDSEEVVIRVLPQDAGILINEAEVSADEVDPNLADNTDDETTTVSPTDLSISKSESADPVLLGSSLTYTLTIANLGPNNATNIMVTDTLPSNINLQSVSISNGGSCTTPSGQVICNWSSMNDGALPRTITIVIIPNAVGVLTNSAQITALQPDPNTTNNIATITTEVDPVIDLVINKSDNTDPVTAGTNLTYNLTVDNNGPSDATGVTITDNLPAGVTFVSASAGCSHNSGNGTVTCNVGSLDSGDDSSVNITVTVNSSTTGSLSNSASVTANEFDSNSANNSEGETTTVQQRTDLSLAKVDTPDPVLAGGDVTYHLTVTNNGPSDVTNASAITVTDTLPLEVDFVSASPGCSHAGGTVTCILGNLPSGNATSVDIVARVKSSTTALSISNSATVSAATDLNPANNSANAATTVNRQADLSLTKTGSAESVLPNGDLTYNLTVTNNGPSDAANVTLTDNLPSAVTFVSAPGCSEAGGVVTCNLGSITSGGNVSVSIAVKVKIDATGVIINSASVTSVVTDPTSGNNSATEDTFIGEFEKVFLPITWKPALVELSIFNDNTGGDVTFTVIGTGVSCTVPNNVTQFCGSFPAGTYQVQVVSVCGPAATFTRAYGGGPATTRIFCQ